MSSSEDKTGGTSAIEACFVTPMTRAEGAKISATPLHSAEQTHIKEMLRLEETKVYDASSNAFAQSRVRSRGSYLSPPYLIN